MIFQPNTRKDFENSEFRESQSSDWLNEEAKHPWAGDLKGLPHEECDLGEATRVETDGKHLGIGKCV